MSIVFAHFHSPLPRHLLLNLKRTSELFPDQRIFLLTDTKSVKLKMDNLNVFQISPNKEWIKLENLLAHDRNFRNNFWFTSLARFLAIAEFASSHRDEIFHLESDVIISSDFPFRLFTQAESSFLFPIVSDSRAIASCLYIKNFEAANYLASLAITEAMKNSNTTDMHVLRKLSQLNSENFKMLPTTPSQKSAMPEVNDDFLKENDKMVSYFGGVFDGFDLGRYLFGMDPRNKRGFSTLRDFDSSVYLNVRKLNFSVKDKREFPYILDVEKNEDIPVFALHIHSKNIKLFMPREIHKTIRKAVSESTYGPKRKFYLKTFCNSVKLSILRRYHYFIGKSLN